MIIISPFSRAVFLKMGNNAPMEALKQLGGGDGSKKDSKEAKPERRIKAKSGRSRDEKLEQREALYMLKVTEHTKNKVDIRNF